jgi:hypothetical protein
MLLTTEKVAVGEADGTADGRTVGSREGLQVTVGKAEMIGGKGAVGCSVRMVG